MVSPPLPGPVESSPKPAPPAHPSRPRYRLSGRLCWRQLDAEWLVFNSATGALRHADVVDAAVFTLLEAGAATAEELSVTLAAEIGQELPQTHRDGLSDLLDQLELAGFLVADPQ
jgi:hypothetical protein